MIVKYRTRLTALPNLNYIICLNQIITGERKGKNLMKKKLSLVLLCFLMALGILGLSGLSLIHI